MATMHGFMQALELKDAINERATALGARLQDCWTWQSVGSDGRTVRTTTDHILVSRCISKEIYRVGVLQGGPDSRINDTDHRFIFAEINLSAFLGWDIKAEKARKKASRPRKPMLRQDDQKKVRAYHKEVAETWQDKELDRRIANLEAAAEWYKSTVDAGEMEWGTDVAWVQQAMDSTMRQAAAAILEAERRVLPSDHRTMRPRAKKKIAVNKETVAMAQKVRRLMHLCDTYRHKHPRQVS